MSKCRGANVKDNPGVRNIEQLKGGEKREQAISRRVTTIKLTAAAMDYLIPTKLATLHTLPRLILTEHCEVGTVIKKSRLREINLTSGK